MGRLRRRVGVRWWRLLRGRGVRRWRLWELLMDSCLRLGTGLGWRPAFAGYIERRTESSDLGFVEVLAEHVSGVDRDDGFYRDTHRHPVPRPVFDLLAELRSRCAPPGVLVEWDGHFPSEAELDAELRAVTGVLV